MEERLRQLGWREIEVVDDDWGRSAAGTVPRAGFARMVAEVLFGQGGGSGRARGIAIRTQQPRVATVD